MKRNKNNLPFEGEMGASSRKESDYQIPNPKKPKPYSTKEAREKGNFKAKSASQFAGK